MLCQLFSKEHSSPDHHYVLKTKLNAKIPKKCDVVLFGMGCFWGAEQLFWRLKGVVCTSVGFAGGCKDTPVAGKDGKDRKDSKRLQSYTIGGDVEVVRVVYDPLVITFEELLRVFWECHDPTQLNGQGNDIGTLYRSAVLVYTDAQFKTAAASQAVYQVQLHSKSKGNITTEISHAAFFDLASAYHQQYLAKHPRGYCGLRSTGVKYTPAAAATPRVC